MTKRPPGRRLLLQGNEAIVEGALAAGCRFFAGYPITPATEISEVMSYRLPTVDGAFIQMEDEIASLGTVIGASLAGVKSMTATSGPGFSLMQENLGFACVAEVPCVIVNVMRGGPSTGLPTRVSQGDVMQARWKCSAGRRKPPSRWKFRGKFTVGILAGRDLPVYTQEYDKVREAARAMVSGREKPNGKI
jgi:hypothetical protein